MLSNKDKNLVDRFEKSSIYKFNLSFWKTVTLTIIFISLLLHIIIRCIKMEHFDIKYIVTRILRFDMICYKIKNAFNFWLDKWQVLVILNSPNAFEIVININTSLGINLLFQIISLIKIRVILLVLLLMIA